MSLETGVQAIGFSDLQCFQDLGDGSDSLAPRGQALGKGLCALHFSGCSVWCALDLTI